MLLLCGGAACSDATAATVAAVTPTADGAALYDRYCLPCHGSKGDGKGPGAPWLYPPPRDFTKGEYRWRTTTSGSPPTRADLVAAIRKGVAGTSMHAFAILDDTQIDALIGVLKGFAPRKFRKHPEPAKLTNEPVVDEAMLARGKQVYVDIGCDKCHGMTGVGDGPSVAEQKPPPYDLTTLPMRRPGGASLEAVYISLVTGLDGTPMPSYTTAAPDADLWAVAAFTETYLYRAGPLPDPTTVALETVRATDSKSLPAALWPGSADDRDAIVWGAPLAFQGTPPDVLAPAQASLLPDQCSRCHAKQVREWQPSLHAKAMSVGVNAQLSRMGARAKISCKRCHAPMPEQREHLAPEYGANPLYDDAFADAAVACAVCHVRGWQRLGPPRVPDSRLLAQPGYPFTELPIYQRADFCLPCHQLPPWNTRLVAGATEDRSKRKPLLNTYREWLEGPYMRRGIQCQHCHMPNREHTFLGIHDPDTFRQGIELETLAGRSPNTGAVSVRARVTNVGAGHYLPTTLTPAAWLQIELLDADLKPIAGARAEQRIGRHLTFERGRFHEHEDTRIPPGESIELARAWKDGRVASAKWARVRVRVSPDDYYIWLFERRLKGKLTPAQRAQYLTSLAEKKAAVYLATERLVEIR